MEQENKHLNATEEDTIDIIAVLKEFWVARKTILKITLVFTLLGLFVAIFSKNEFTAETTFVPVNQGGESIKGNLGGLASLAGINLGSNSDGVEISPKLYPQIFNSIPFQLELLNTPLSIQGQEQLITYKEFYKNIYKLGLLENIKKYSLGLPFVVLSSFRSENKQKETSLESQIINISLEDYNLINKVLVSQIGLNVNEKEGFVTISVTLPEALASAQFALKAQKLLQAYVLKLKTQKAIEQLQYLEARFLEKQNEFDSVKIEFARFQDQNSSINTSLGNIKFLQLQSDYDLAFTVYSELAKQLETQRLQVKKDTPLFTILKPVTIPIEKSGPKRFLILVIYLFLGFILSLGWVFGKRYLANFRKEWTQK